MARLHRFPLTMRFHDFLQEAKGEAQVRDVVLDLLARRADPGSSSDPCPSAWLGRLDIPPSESGTCQEPAPAPATATAAEAAEAGAAG